jgi:hypothetical protein
VRRYGAARTARIACEKTNGGMRPRANVKRSVAGALRLFLMPEAYEVKWQPRQFVRRVRELTGISSFRNLGMTMAEAETR